MNILLKYFLFAFFLNVMQVNANISSQDNSVPEIGKPAPEVSGINVFSSEKILLSEMKGKYVLIDFWATTCGPCIREFPNIMQVYEKYNRSEFEVIGVVDDRTNGQIMDFLKEKNVVWPTIIRYDKGTVAKNYKFGRYPASYLIDPDGNLVDINLRGKKLLDVLDEKRNKK